MTRHLVDPNDRTIDGDDVATWLLFFIEAHGAEVTWTETRAVRVNLDPIAGLDADTVSRWAPVIMNLIPAMREILLARRSAAPLASRV